MSPHCGPGLLHAPEGIGVSRIALETRLELDFIAATPGTEAPACKDFCGQRFRVRRGCRSRGLISEHHGFPSCR